MLNRRDFLKTAGLAAGTLALPGLTGCAMGTRPRGHVVVVGGGYGGATVAAQLRQRGLAAAVWSCLAGTCHQPNESSSITATIKDAQVFTHILMNPAHV